jgi:hypothetical protein
LLLIFRISQSASSGQIVVAHKERISQVISNCLIVLSSFLKRGTISVSAEVTREKSAATTGERLGEEQMSDSSSQILVRIKDTSSGDRS